MLRGGRLICCIAVFAIILTAYATTSEVLKKKKDDGKSNGNFDYFVLSMQWPGSVCRQLGRKPCDVPQQVSRANFTVHGLWPNSYSGDHPFFCRNIPFDYDLMKRSDEYKDMQRYWSDFLHKESEFWSHEWEKHGTCAIGVDNITDQQSYFQATLDFVEKFYVFESLYKHGIVPDDNKRYAVTDIFNAFYNDFGVQASMYCKVKDLFGELRWCLTKDLKLMDCPSSLRTECASSVLMPITKYSRD